MMKKHLLVSVLLLVIVSAFGPPKPKPKPKAKPPSQKELGDIMKEMQSEIDNMSAEDKKMMDSLGIKMPDVKSIQKNMSGSYLQYRLKYLRKIPWAQITLM